MNTPSRSSFAFPPGAFVLGLLAVLNGDPAVAQSWSKGPYLTSGSCPPFVFVRMSRATSLLGVDAAPDRDNGGRLALGSPGRELWFMDKLRSDPVLIFPLPGGQYAPDLMIHINYTGTSTPVPLAHGSVHEPHVYHHAPTDQFWVIFSYARDLQSTSVTRPCDLYAINITPAVADPTGFNPLDLDVFKLTSAARTVADLRARAFNPDLVQQDGYSTFHTWGAAMPIDEQFETNTGACVVDEEHNPVLYWASNERRTDGEGIMAGDLVFDGAGIQLVNKREIFHFGTTSLISLFPTPRGAGGAYRSNTEATGIWGMFEFRSDEAQWQTLSGYSNQENIVDHNGTTIAIGDDPNNSLLAISRYYIGNNQGFGTIILLPYNQVGRNSDNGGEDIAQIGHFSSGSVRNLFPAIPEFDDNDRWDGKFALPSAGRRVPPTPNSAELFLTYSPGPAHGGGNVYHAKLAVVTSLAGPISPPYFSSGSVQMVLEHPNEHAFAMQPVLTHNDRFGWKHRDVLPLPGRLDPATLPAAVANLPVAQVMAGPVYNTDVRTIKQRFGSHDPTTEFSNNQNTHKISMRVSCLTKDQDPSFYNNLANYQNPNNPDKVWGVRIFVTDPMTRKVISPNSNPGNTQPYWPGLRWGYLHHSGFGPAPWGTPIPHERYRHLSDVQADATGMVNFVLPANVPVKFNLLHKDATILAPHRNHHSFAPGQLENRCTGCHQHVASGPPTASVAGTPFDTMTQTGRYEWNASGVPTFSIVNQTTVAVPEFRDDIFPLLQSECGQCHEPTSSSYTANPPAIAKFNMDMPRTVAVGVDLDKPMANWLWLHQQRYINRRYGAAKSPLAWIFAGRRLDGEANSSYQSLPGSKYWFTSSQHPGVTDQRNAYKVVEWLDAGAAIDHGAVAPDGTDDERRGVKGDGFQIALSAKLASFGSPTLNIGYWDVDPNVTVVRVTLRTAVDYVMAVPLPAYGSVSHDLLQHVGSGPPLGMDEVVTIEAIDAAQNRTSMQKTLRQLMLESETHRGTVQLTTSTPSVSGQNGGSAVFSVDGASSLAGNYYFLTLALGIHPGYTPDLGTHIYLMPNFDAFFAMTLSWGVLGQLDPAGNANYTLNVGPGTGAVELYGTANIFLPNGTFAKSNIRRFKIN